MLVDFADGGLFDLGDLEGDHHLFEVLLGALVGFLDVVGIDEEVDGDFLFLLTLFVIDCIRDFYLKPEVGVAIDDDFADVAAGYADEGDFAHAFADFLLDAGFGFGKAEGIHEVLFGDGFDEAVFGLTEELDFGMEPLRHNNNGFGKRKANVLDEWIFSQGEFSTGAEGGVLRLVGLV